MVDALVYGFAGLAGNGGLKPLLLFDVIAAEVKSVS